MTTFLSVLFSSLCFRCQCLLQFRWLMFVYLLHRGDDYKNHVKCISEDQKYGGKGYEAKANKGDVKQQQWIQVNRAHVKLAGFWL